MEQKPLTLLIALLILAGAVAAGWYVLSRPVPPASLPSDHTPSDTGTRGTYEDSGEYYEISGSYPLSIGLSSSAEADAVGFMKAFVEREAARFRDESVGSLTPEDIAIQELGGERKYVLDMEYEEKWGPRTVSFIYRMYADTLGAHPNAYYRTFTFDTATGKGLGLDELFLPSANHLDVLSLLSREKLSATLGEGNFDQEYLEAGTTPDADNFQNFYFEGDALVILFPPYQVGPWVLGVQTAVIPRAELGNALKEEYR